MATRLAEAAASGDLATLEEELANAPSVDLLEGAVLAAVSSNRVDTLKRLLSTVEERVVVEALHHAVSTNRMPEVTGTILATGVNPDAVRTDGRTRTEQLFGDEPIDLALLASVAGSEGAKELLALTTDPPRPTSLNTALIAAASSGTVENVELLLGAGANVNHQGDGGTTALSRAVFAGNVPVVERLLSSGADSGLRDDENRSARDIAEQCLQSVSGDASTRIHRLVCE